MLVTVLGIVQLARGKAAPSLREPWFAGSSLSPSAYSLALYSGLWAFDGWDQANYVGGEMHHPEKNIPRAIHSSMIIVTVSLPNIRPFKTVLTDPTAPISFGQLVLFRCSGQRFGRTQQHCSDGLWSRNLGDRWRNPICVIGGNFLLWGPERYVHADQVQRAIQLIRSYQVQCIPHHFSSPLPGESAISLPFSGDYIPLGKPPSTLHYSNLV